MGTCIPSDFFMGEKMRDIYDLTDEELVKLFQEGNEWCFNEIYNRYSGKLLGYATKHVRSKEDAEEITNTTFALTFKYLNKLEENQVYQPGCIVY